LARSFSPGASSVQERHHLVVTPGRFFANATAVVVPVVAVGDDHGLGRHQPSDRRDRRIIGDATTDDGARP